MTDSQPEETFSDVALISVRGTTEPQSGSRLLMPVGELIRAELPDRVSYSELEYPADFDFAASVPRGVDTLVRLLNDAATEHPERRHVLMGYSQGAWVIGEALVPPVLRNAGRTAPELCAAAASRIAAVLFYGDPRFTSGEPFNAGTFDEDKQSENPRPAGHLAEYADRMQNYCAAGDIACQGNGGTYIAHMAYLTNSMREEGAQFALQQLRAHQPSGDRT